MIRQIQHNILYDLPGIQAQMKMAPPIRTAQPNIPKKVRYSAVCTLLFYRQQELHTLLIKRTEDGKTHSGQISFPGGRLDDNDFSLTYCALRECEEEIGLAMNKIKVLGNLSNLYIPPSNFMVSPVLCFTNKLENLIPSPDEVSQIIEVPVSELFHPATKKTHEVIRSDNNTLSMKTPIYHYQDHIIWGATAMMLSELEEIYLRVK